MTISGDFGVVSHLLAAAQKHSTSVGKIWISVLFVFRIFVLITAAKEVWQDEQSNFLCDTNQPGCQLGCYDKTFPVSHVRFWVMQIIFVSTPTLVYLGFVVHKTRIDKKKKNRTTKDQNHQIYIENLKEETTTKDRSNTETRTTKDKDDQTSNKDSNNEPEVLLEGPVRKMYIANVVSKILLEIAFFVAQYYLYGFGLESMYTCEQWPCLTKVFCYVSRPTEKTIFIIFMLLVALLSLLLNVLELGYIFWKKKKKDSECDSVQSNFECKSVQCSIDRNSSEIDSLSRNSRKRHVSKSVQCNLGHDSSENNSLDCNSSQINSLDRNSRKCPVSKSVQCNLGHDSSQINSLDCNSSQINSLDHNSRKCPVSKSVQYNLDHDSSEIDLLNYKLSEIDSQYSKSRTFSNKSYV